MTQLTEFETSAPAETLAAASDRRRPGRLENINAGLIPILRGEQPELDFEHEEENAALRGLVIGVLISAPIWVAIAYLGSLVLSE